MTDLLIKPTKLKGKVEIPPSKSMAHRAIIAASLAPGESTINNIQLSDDIIATIEAMRLFGADILLHPTEKYSKLSIKGVKSFQLEKTQTIDANESGSTLRFLIPISTLFNQKTHFIGRGKLGTRPLDTYAKIFTEQGLRFQQAPTEQLDLTVDGALQSGYYELAGNISSQFITGLLFTLPLLAGISVIQITTEIESLSYIDLTLAVLADFGVQVSFDLEKRRIEIPGNQVFKARDYTVEGDYSQAAFFLVAGALSNDIQVSGLTLNSQQGDRAILTILEQFNADVHLNETQEITVSNSGLRSNTTVDGAQIPDIIPITALLASLSEGETHIINLERLRIKESDRLEATKEELQKLGAQINIIGDSLQVSGIKTLQGPATVSSHKDHRMAMMLAIASTVCEHNIILKDAECVAKSYPTFWDDFVALGGQISEWNMG